MRLSLLLWNSLCQDWTRQYVSTSSAVLSENWSHPAIQRLRRISDQTVRGSLRQGRIRPRRHYVGPVSTPVHRLVSYIENMDFEELALNLVQRWVTFSSPKMWWMNPRVQPLKSPFACVQEGGWYGDGSAMVWAEIFNNHKANLVRVQGNLTGQRYRDDIVQQHILNVIDRQREIFQRGSMDFLTQNNINVLPWSSISPNLNPKSLEWTS